MDPLAAGLIVLIASGLALMLWVRILVRLARMSRAPSLQEEFQALGILKGRTADEILEAVGPPNARSTYHNGRFLLQWLESGYHISLEFDANGVCAGVSHESAFHGL